MEFIKLETLRFVHNGIVQNRNVLPHYTHRNPVAFLLGLPVIGAKRILVKPFSPPASGYIGAAGCCVCPYQCVCVWTENNE